MAKISWEARHRSLRWVASIVAAGVLLLVSCAGDDDPLPTASADPPTTPTATTRPTTDSTGVTPSTTEDTPTTPSTSPSTSDASPEQQIIDRYVGYWETRFAANRGTPDPDDPALAEYATGAQLDAVRAETRQNLEAGVAFRSRDDPADFRRVRVISVDGGQAVVQECFVDDGLVVQRDTGQVVNDTVATHNVRGELTRVDGRWRVARAELIQRWEGVAGCALDS